MQFCKRKLPANCKHFFAKWLVVLWMSLGENKPIEFKCIALFFDGNKFTNRPDGDYELFKELKSWSELNVESFIWWQIAFKVMKRFRKVIEELFQTEVFQQLFLTCNIFNQFFYLKFFQSKFHPRFFKLTFNPYFSKASSSH